MHPLQYSISKLIQNVIDHTRLSDSDFVRVLGYSNVNKGLRKLSAWRNSGCGQADFLKRIAEQFSVSDADLEASLIRTVEELSAEHCARHRAQ